MLSPEPVSGMSASVGLRHRIAGRAALAVVLFALFVQYLLLLRVGEPYPAIRMPGFRGTGGFHQGRVTRRRPEIVFTYDDGRERSFSQTELLREYPVSHHASIMRVSMDVPGDSETPRKPKDRREFRFRIFPYLKAGELDRMTHPMRASLRAWLARRAVELAPGSRPVHARVRWYRDTYRVADTSGTPSRTSELEGVYSILLIGERDDGGP